MLSAADSECSTGIMPLPRRRMLSESGRRVSQSQSAPAVSSSLLRTSSPRLVHVLPPERLLVGSGAKPLRGHPKAHPGLLEAWLEVWRALAQSERLAPWHVGGGSCDSSKPALTRLQPPQERYPERPAPPEFQPTERHPALGGARAQPPPSVNFHARGSATEC